MLPFTANEPADCKCEATKLGSTIYRAMQGSAQAKKILSVSKRYQYVTYVGMIL